MHRRVLNDIQECIKELAQRYLVYRFFFGEEIAGRVAAHEKALQDALELFQVTRRHHTPL
jgi:hypothetical protein